MIDTNETLLDRLKVESAHDAWEEFYRHYWQPILRYTRKLGLNEHQSHEVLQETMVALMRILPEFAYDRCKGHFRNFLLTIVHRKSLVALRRFRRGSEVPWSEAIGSDGIDPCDNRETVEAEALARWRESLLEEALCRLRDDVTLGENTFAIFQAYAIKREPVAAVTAAFGVKKNAIYQIKNRLLRRLQSEVAALARSSGAE